MWQARSSRHDVERARAERELSQQRLDDAQVAVIIPLRELRAENHIQDLVQRTFQRRPKEDG